MRYFLNVGLDEVGSTALPNPSPDLTPSEFYLWALINSYIYNEKFLNIEYASQTAVESVSL